MGGATNQPGVRGYFDASEVLAAARGRWEQVLAGFGVRTELLAGRHGPCPGCGGRDRFRFDDKEGAGTFICSQGGGGNLAGNGLTLLQHVTGWEWKQCVEEIGRKLLSESQRRGWNGVSGETRAPTDDLPAEPQAERENVPAYNAALLRAYVEPVSKVTRADLKRVSPVPVEKATAAEFLECLYRTDERVLAFTDFYSQGNFLYQVGRGACRLSPTRGVKAVLSLLPTTGREGVWFLCNPVDGKWQPGSSKRTLVKLPPDQHGPPYFKELPGEWGRRRWQNLTSYRYAVLESDVASEDLWLRALIKLPLPIVAIYSSGGKSLHALVRIDAGDKPTWDMCVRGRSPGLGGRNAALMNLVCPLGADASALTAVRLTRLPFCFREGTVVRGKGYQRYDAPRLQELVYLSRVDLDKPAEWKSIEMRHGGGR